MFSGILQKICLKGQVHGSAHTQFLNNITFFQFIINSMG